MRKIMITDKLRDATQKALAALVLIGRAPDTVDHYRIAFLHISRIAARFLSTEIDAEEFLKRYSLARTAYLNATLAPRYLQQRHERELNLLLLPSKTQTLSRWLKSLNKGAILVWCLCHFIMMLLCASSQHS